MEPGIPPTRKTGPNVLEGTLRYPLVPSIFTPRDFFDGKIIAPAKYDGKAIFLAIQAGPGKRYWGLVPSETLANQYHKEGANVARYTSCLLGTLRLYEGLIRDQSCPFDGSFSPTRNRSSRRDSTRLKSTPCTSHLTHRFRLQ